MKIVMMGSGSYKSSLSIRIVALGKHLASLGWNVAIIMPSADKYNDFKSEPQASIPSVKLIQPWQLTTKSAILNLIPYLFTSLVALLREHADVVYLYKPTPITIVGLLPRLLFRRPVILDFDDLGSEVMKAQRQSVFQYKLVAWCERLALRFASAVVVTSTYLESLVSQRYPHKKVLVLANGVEPLDYPLAPATKPRNAIYYFGAINRLSLIDTLLYALPEVIRNIPDVKVTIVGGGKALPEAKQLAKKLRVDGLVQFTGWVDMLEVQKYAHFADLAICCQPDTPTVRAASNMKVFQYMAMSTVPVVSDVGDLGSYVELNRAGVVVPPDDPNNLAKALVTLMNDHGLRMALAHRARDYAETKYSWQWRTRELHAFICTLPRIASRRSSNSGLAVDNKIGHTDAHN
jgi:glycosyltransferase involved in cell wall biosynthesis